MKYKDIPFLIWAEEAETAKQISKLLGRETNTLIESASPEKAYKYLDKIEYFSCNVFHYTDEKSILYDLIKASLKKHPYSAIFLFSFQEISFEKYQNFIRLGVSDILVYRGEESQDILLECLLKTLNYRWKSFRYLQKERKKIFDATVVTAYHELNQPLTVMLNAISLFNIETKNHEVNAEKVQNLIGLVQKSTDRIQEVLDMLKEIKYPQLKEYSRGVPMVKLDSMEIDYDEDV